MALKRDIFDQYLVGDKCYWLAKVVHMLIHGGFLELIKCIQNT